MGTFSTRTEYEDDIAIHQVTKEMVDEIFKDVKWDHIDDFSVATVKIGMVELKLFT